MDLAVRFYGEVPNPRNVPADWPRDVLEIPDGAPLPDGFLHRFTVDGLASWKAARQSLFDAWFSQQAALPSYREHPQAVFFTANSMVETESTKVVIPYNGAMQASPLFDLLPGGIAVAQADVLAEITADVTAEASKVGSATAAEIWIEVNGIPVAGTLARMVFPSKDLGISARTFGVIGIHQGDQVQVTLRRVKGSATIRTIPNGCRLRLRGE